MLFTTTTKNVSNACHFHSLKVTKIPSTAVPSHMDIPSTLNMQSRRDQAGLSAICSPDIRSHVLQIVSSFYCLLCRLEEGDPSRSMTVVSFVSGKNGKSDKATVTLVKSGYNHVIGRVLEKVRLGVLCKGWRAVAAGAPSPCVPKTTDNPGIPIRGSQRVCLDVLLQVVSNDKHIMPTAWF